MFSLSEENVVYSIPLYGEQPAIDILFSVNAGPQAGARPPAPSVEKQGWGLVASLTSASIIGEVENVVPIISRVAWVYHQHHQTQSGQHYIKKTYQLSETLTLV